MKKLLLNDLPYRAKQWEKNNIYKTLTTGERIEMRMIKARDRRMVLCRTL